MNDKIINFTQIVFYLEDSIKEIFIDYIEEDSEFLSIDFSKVKKVLNFSPKYSLNFGIKDIKMKILEIKDKNKLK